MAVVPSAFIGDNKTPVVTPVMFCGITVMTPAALVATDKTYLDVALADSQPHALAAGKDADVLA